VLSLLWPIMLVLVFTLVSAEAGGTTTADASRMNARRDFMGNPPEDWACFAEFSRT
jgi:hypothetical protein